METEETGYLCVSVRQGFMDPDAKKYGDIKGVHTDWVYDHLGVYAFSTELWNIMIEAGVEVKDFIEDMRNRTEETDLKVLCWADENLPGEAFLPWQPFDHPQLCAVEIGGWNFKFSHQKPPGPYYANESRKAVQWGVNAQPGTVINVEAVARNGGTAWERMTLA
jgi:hypothetical protein